MHIRSTLTKGSNVKLTVAEKNTLRKAQALCNLIARHAGGELAKVSMATSDQLLALSRAVESAETPLLAPDEPTPPPAGKTD